MMLKRLRFQLTILYLLASMSLVGLTGAGTYLLLQRYLQAAADQALEYKMALQFEQYGLKLPPELALAEQNWLKDNSQGRSSAQEISASTNSPVASDLANGTAQPSSTPLATPTALATATSAATTAGATTAAPPTPTATAAATAGVSATPQAFAPDSAAGVKSAGLKPSMSRIIPVSVIKDQGEGGDDSSKNSAESEGSAQPQVSNPQPERNAPSPSATPATNAGANAEATDSLILGTLPHSSHGDLSGDDLDARLAPIFVTPLDNNGKVDAAIPALPGPKVILQPTLFDSQAAAAAILAGVDWRTVVLPGGSRLRLLTYRTSAPNGPALLQAGRLLNDQDNLLKTFLTGILILSGFSVILLGLASWWLSGRSLGPAGKAWDQQQAFISNASHELRTPLTLIQATTEVALRGQPNPQQKDYLNNILDEIHYMNHMVDDLLLLARHDARRLKLSREAVSLPNLFSETRRQVGDLAAERGVALSLGEAGGAVWADTARLRQVLLILLDNAIRYTPRGGTICLEALRHGRLNEITVSDDGAGIPAEYLPHVFERFYQAPGPGREETRSNGLGLSIAKALVEAMNGKISIESQPGEGTQVTIQLPAAVLG